MRLLAALVVLSASISVLRADADWPLKFSEASSKDLIAIHESLIAPRLDSVSGVAVHDVMLKIDAAELRIKSGTVYLEPPVDGIPVGAFFVGEATARFAPAGDEQRRELSFWFGQPTLDDEPVTSAYVFSLTGTDLLAQLSASGAPSVPLGDASAAYAEAKHALRQRGLSTLSSFLDRDGRSKGAVYAILAAPKIRVDQSKSSLLMLRFDPESQEECAVEGYGHVSIIDTLPWKFTFNTLVSQASSSPRFTAQANDVSYGIDLKLGRGMDTAEQTSKIKLTAAPGARVLRFELTSFLQVESVRLGADRPLPFLQWKREGSGNDMDSVLVIDLGTSPPSGPIELTIKSTGGLFEPFFDAFYLVDEDSWYPHMGDVRQAGYELTVTLPKDRLVVAPGKLIEDTTDGETRRYRFATTRPQKASSLYIGKFQHKSGEADGTKIEVYVDKTEKNLSYGVVEIANIVKVFNRLLTPLSLDTFRVAAAPIDHGRGFDGLLLLSRGSGFETSSSDAHLFRAHEVAHQWWGNIVNPALWPRDRWLSESFAEYCGMEYHRARFEDAKKTRDTIFRQWMQPLENAQKTGSKNLRADARTGTFAEQWSILDGTGNVYTKGPMVLQMLRYVTRVKTGKDEVFWEILRSFVKESSGKPASTEDFIKVTERVLGGDMHWFFDQWLWRTEIPKVRWSHRLDRKDGKVLLTVEAEQLGTEFALLIPVYAHFGGDRQATGTLVMKGRTGRAQMLLPEEPARVTINDNWEALIDVVP